MTNEEKANEIALKYAREYVVSKNDSHKQNILFKESSIIECEKASLEMAKWKDERIYRDEFLEAEKEALIDKACEWWENELTYPTMTQADIDDFVLGRIKEFKQAMKGGSNE